MSGDIPDILNLSGLQETSINGDDYLIDLLPYMKECYGEQLSGVKASVCEALMEGDKLLTITPNFKLRILCSLTPVESDLTVEQFVAILSESNDTSMISRDMVLDILLENTLSDLIDMEANSLDIEVLQDILIQANRFPKASGTDALSAREALYSGSMRFYSADLSSFRSFRQLIYDLGDGIYIYGYPGISEDSVVMEANNYLAITTASKHPDAAWQFISSMMESDFQKKYSHRTFPLVTEVLDDFVEEAKNSKSGFSDKADDLLDNMFAKISQGSITNISVKQIITEEAEAYFSGDKEVEEVVKIIKNRVQIYLSEQD